MRLTGRSENLITNYNSYRSTVTVQLLTEINIYRSRPGRRCQVCYWCIIEDSRKRQHHHRHLEHKDTKSCRETSGTNTRNGQVQTGHHWTQWDEKNFGETTTEEGHNVFFSGKEDKHERDAGFLIHKDITNTVMGCRPVSRRLITIRLRAFPFNITIEKTYTPTSTYNDNEIKDF